MFVCYLDDSDTDLGSNICIGGYYAKLEEWLHFEQEVASVFSSFHVEVLRGKDIIDGKGSFKNWSANRKIEFTEAVFTILSRCVIQGVSSCVDKKWFRREKDSGRLEYQNLSALGLAFSATVGSIAYRAPDGGDPISEGISFFIETGHKSNGNIERLFSKIADPTGILPPHSSLTFVDKRSCRAIQVADMLAFFSRKEINRVNPNIRPRRASFDHPIFKAMKQGIRYRFNHLWDKPGQFDLDWEELTDDRLSQSAIVMLPKHL
ncbi:DUF3800 domain-containing protein [Pleomorphomonas sp. PLEO]|uniref:DUF3800 domain-containing protein n=1 Tax=Pleomorphomonas sp. PLEO TaxID=3239306 RepID=UPI00351DAC13